MTCQSIALRLVPTLIAASLALLPAGPARAADDTTQTRPLASFDRVRLDGAFKTEIVAGGARSQIVIRGERDIVTRVTTGIESGTLVVGMRHSDGIFNSFPKLVITLPALRGFANDGAGTVKISGLTGGDVDIANAGAGAITVAGRAANMKITLDGTGKIDTTAVDAHDVRVDNNGLGGVYVRANGSLTMNVNGVGEIRYAGNPTHVESHVEGIGRTGRL
jgi:hypothetical protein